MLYFTYIYTFNIIIKHDVINASFNIESYIKNYIFNNILYTNINDVILTKLISFSYSYPKILPNIVNNENCKILIQGEFDCIIFIKDMIINNLIKNDSNKIDNVHLYTKKIDKIDITCIDINNNEL